MTEGGVGGSHQSAKLCRNLGLEVASRKRWVMHIFFPGPGLTAVCLPASRDPAEHLNMIRIIKRGVARKALKEVDD